MPVLAFDYDGVIADTEGLHWKSWAELLSKYDLRYSWDDYCKFGRGVDDRRICEVMAGRVPGLKPAELLQRNLVRKDLVHTWSLESSPISSETVMMLAALSAYPLGLVTSSGKREVEPILRASGICEYFAAMVFGDDVVATKPAPDPYLLIASQLGEAGIAFEDSQAGMESAQAAGFTVVMVDHPSKLSRLVEQSLEAEKPK